ncbi:MAG: V-type ATP synthase subunit F [Candidatus Diapherotrites archaeon]|nr:V-type ATP synthase subunit F [Candidatus Diapherotrites archaeon]
MKIQAIGPRRFVIGFRLAGIEGVIAETKEHALHNVDMDAGIIITTYQYYEEVENFVKSRRKRTFPIVIPLPEKPGEERQNILDEITKEAIGFNVEVKG